ncbi:unnamed protein product [Diatraea saccharalis]|uniref:Uncharacterized protein n=1 Tax=Diatraea saccharalis TaxID=40085 RepID=A0A9N9QXJ6_9NEOP|nr:unnamed protein product [Diatraea saccharalis]
MSAQKNIDTKVPDDGNTDSGFLSGPIDPLDSGDLGVPSDRISETVKCDIIVEDETPDSGLDLCTSFSNLDLNTPLPTHTTNVSDRVKVQNLPQTHLLFTQDVDGDTQLHIAAVHGSEKFVGILIHLCPDKSLLNIQNDYRHTPLHLAVMGGYAVVAKMLVIAGASLNARDICGRTPVHIAAETCDVECLKAMLAPIEEQPHRKLSSVLNQKDFNAINLQQRYRDVLERRAVVLTESYRKNPSNGFSNCPAQKYCFNISTTSSPYLLRDYDKEMRNPKLPVSFTLLALQIMDKGKEHDKYFFEGIQAAASLSCLRAHARLAVSAVKDSSFNVTKDGNRSDGPGYTHVKAVDTRTVFPKSDAPLNQMRISNINPHHSLKCRLPAHLYSARPAVARAAARHSALLGKPHVRSPPPRPAPPCPAAFLDPSLTTRQTCVHLAATAGHIKTLQTLVYYGADINAREGLAGWTALHIAARRGDARTAQYLLEQCPGVARRARDCGGRSARRLAARTPAERLFAERRHDSDSDSDTDDDYDSEGETLFEKLLSKPNPINVA